VGTTFSRLAFSYWIDNLGFITERKLAAIFIKPSLGVSNWLVIYFINYTPTSFLAPSNAIKLSSTIIAPSGLSGLCRSARNWFALLTLAC
jgi:hypothetical protein